MDSLRMRFAMIVSNGPYACDVYGEACFEQPQQVIRQYD